MVAPELTNVSRERLLHGMNAKQIGVLAVLCASVMWATEPVLAKLAYRNSTFLETSGVRAIFVMLIAFMYAAKTHRRDLTLRLRQLPPLLYIAVAGTLFADLVYFFALSKIPVINATLIGHMQPIFIILFGLFSLKEERLTRYDGIGIAFMIASGLFVTTKTLPNLTQLRFGSIGDLLALCATVAWATTAIAMRRYLRTMNAGVITFFRYMFASVAFVAYLVPTSSMRVANVYQVFIGIVVAVGTILYYEGLKRIKAAQVSAVELATPFFATLLGFLVLGELVTPMQIVGILMLPAGIYCLSKREELS